ncbi:HAMP domain-containing protein [Clostridium sp. AM58-1XD]|uniref:sensor histidine kinase n=1 Tax=Clostridium sp. AM58-1XD TaxID=2292307 RepID=UPI001FA92512|nr:HAMP domain-containing protein [Clostridium sp. AM58-1XD]
MKEIKPRIVKISLKSRLKLLLFLIAIPLTCMVLGILVMINNYSNSYNRMMANLKIANAYNMTFKQDMEYSMYRVMIGLIDTDKFKDGDIVEGMTQYATVVKNPFNMIDKARRDLGEKIERIPGSDEDIKIKGILSCMDSLEKAVDRMIDNSKRAGTYDENNSIWENDIQGLCSLIQEYINQYIYYETINMERLQQELETHTRQIVYGFMVLLVAVLLVGIFLSAMITKTVTKPINNLKMTAERLGQGDLQARAELGGLEEINVLARTFNRMSSEIAALMEKTKTEQQNLRVAEFKLLQAQINPHSSIIRWIRSYGWRKTGTMKRWWR